jgi:hypothetical protein
MYMPSSWTLTTSFTSGDSLGTATAHASIGDQGGAGLALSGTLQAAAATDTIAYAGATATVSSLAKSCIGGTADAYWVLNLSGGGQNIQLPIFVTLILSGAPLSDFSNARLQLCLPPPDVPSGTPGRALAGIKITQLSLILTAGLSPLFPDWYLWHGTSTPYSPGTGKANTSGSVEIESVDRTYAGVSMKATIVKRKTRKGTKPRKLPQLVQLSGRVTEGGVGVAQAAVQISIGTRKVASTRSKSNGAFSLTLQRPSGTATLIATATVSPRPAKSCQEALFAPLPCVDPTVGGWTSSSDPVKP